MQVGDFGILDKETGRFEFRGNIFVDEELRKLSEPFESRSRSAEESADFINITSSNARKVDVSGSRLGAQHPHVIAEVKKSGF